MSLAQNFTKQLEDLVGVPNAFGSEELSNCCGAKAYGETDICSDCKEHCELETMEELMDDDSEEELENISDNYPNGEII